MCDVSKKLNYLRSMQKGTIPEEFRHDGAGKEYKTIYEKYQAIYKLLDECEEGELDCIEVSLIAGVESWKDLKSFTGIISIFLTSVALMFSSASVCYEALLENKPDETVVWALGMILTGVAVVIVVALLMYFFLDGLPEKHRRTDHYILEILKKVKENHQKEQEAKIKIPDKEDKKVYCSTVCEKQE